MESRTDAFNAGAVTGSLALAQKAAVNQVAAGGMYPGQNGKGADTYNAEQPFIGQALKAGY